MSVMDNFTYVPAQSRGWRSRLAILVAGTLLTLSFGVATCVLVVTRHGDWGFAGQIATSLIVWLVFASTVGQNMCGTGRVWLLGPVGGKRKARMR